MQRVPVYVISLSNAQGRRNQMREHLLSLEIKYKFVDAVKGYELDPEYMREVNPSRKLSPGALGCYLSHLKVYETIIKNNIPVSLVLEDDTVLHCSVKTLLSQECKSFDFDYCYLMGDDHGDEGYIYYDIESAVPISTEHKAYILSSGPYCTGAYLITLEGAKKRMSCAFPVRMAIDNYRFLSYKPLFRAVIPMIAFINEEGSVGSISSASWSGVEQRLRKYWWYYSLRDILKLNSIRKWYALSFGGLLRTGQWRSFRSAVRVVRIRSLRL